MAGVDEWWILPNMLVIRGIRVVFLIPRGGSTMISRVRVLARDVMGERGIVQENAGGTYKYAPAAP